MMFRLTLLWRGAYNLFNMKKNELLKIQKLVGSITEEQMINVDCYVGENVGIFLPVSGPCYYAVLPEHIHPSYMFVYMFDDVTQMVINGEIIPSQFGKIFALAPNIAHHEVFTGNTPKYIAVLIEPAFFEAQLPDYHITPDSLFLNNYYIPSSHLLQLLQKFMLELDCKLPGSTRVLQALSIEICHDLIRSVANVSIENDTISNRLEISRAITFIHTNINEKITVSQIAHSVNMSTSHFARLFKLETGETPLAYLQAVRLERVKKLLVSSNKTITEIALENGFSSSAYLSTSFMKKYDMTPSTYQKKFKSRIL